jgi:hypothetical protein
LQNATYLYNIHPNKVWNISLKNYYIQTKIFHDIIKKDIMKTEYSWDTIMPQYAPHKMEEGVYFDPHDMLKLLVEHYTLGEKFNIGEIHENFGIPESTIRSRLKELYQ